MGTLGHSLRWRINVYNAACDYQPEQQSRISLLVTGVGHFHLHLSGGRCEVVSGRRWFVLVRPCDHGNRSRCSCLGLFRSFRADFQYCGLPRTTNRLRMGSSCCVDRSTRNARYHFFRRIDEMTLIQMTPGSSAILMPNLNQTDPRPVSSVTRNHAAARRYGTESQPA